MLLDIDFGTGKHHDILSNIDGTSHCGSVRCVVIDVDGNITVNWQVELFRLKLCSAHVQCYTDNGHFTHHIKDQAVTGTIILFDYVAACQLKHTAAAGTAQEVHITDPVRIVHVNTRERCFLRSGMDGQWHFNILDIVLRNGEYTLVACCHSGTNGTAAEVRNLEQFIDLRTGVCRHCAPIQRIDRIGSAGDITPSKQFTPVVDRNICAIFHPHKTDSTNRRSGIISGALTGCDGSRQTHGTINNQLCPICQSQCPIDPWCRVFVTNIGRSFLLVQGILFIAGNQQYCSLRDGICSAGQCCIRQQGHLTLHIGHCIKVVGYILACFVQIPCFTRLCKNWYYRLINTGLHSIICISAEQNIIFISPTNKDMATGRCSAECNACCHIYRCTTAYSISINLYRTFAGVIVDGNIRTVRYGG